MPSRRSASPNTRAGRGRRAAITAVLAVVMAALVACGGESAPPTVPRPIAAEAERQRADDGAATLQSTVRLEFGEEIALALEGDELHEAIRIQTPGSHEAPRRVEVLSAGIDGDDPAVLVVETGELVPEGSEVRIHRSALTEGGEGTVATQVASDLTELQVALASRPLAPTRPELFAISEVAPVTAEDHDEEAIRSQLVEHLESRGTTGAPFERALEYFDTMPADIVQAPKLRAALAGLAGTFAEPAIADLLTEDNCTGLPAARIAFQEPPDFPNLLARVTYTETGARVISVHPRLEGEPFQLLMPILLHEAIHCDQISEVDEEIAATAFDTYFYIFLLAVEPWLAYEGTTLSHNFNVDALAMLNSGRMVPESVGVLPSPGRQPVFVGTEMEYRSFAEYIQAAYAQLGPGPSPPEPLAQDYVENLASLLDLPVRDAFNLEYLDGLLGWTMEPEVMMAAIAALGLEPAP